MKSATQPCLIVAKQPSSKKKNINKRPTTSHHQLYLIARTSHSKELVEQAAPLGHRVIAVTDGNTFAGIIRAHAAAKKAGIRLIVGVRLDFSSCPVTFYSLVYSEGTR